METDVNVSVPSKSNKQKNFKKTPFLLSSCQLLTKKQDPDPTVSGTDRGSRPKCPGSPTLEEIMKNSFTFKREKQRQMVFFTIPLELLMNKDPRASFI
jgi:hypothetical protein